MTQEEYIDKAIKSAVQIQLGNKKAQASGNLMQELAAKMKSSLLSTFRHNEDTQTRTNDIASAIHSANTGRLVPNVADSLEKQNIGALLGTHRPQTTDFVKLQVSNEVFNYPNVRTSILNRWETVETNDQGKEASVESINSPINLNGSLH